MNLTPVQKAAWTVSKCENWIAVLKRRKSPKDLIDDAGKLLKKAKTALADAKKA